MTNNINYSKIPTIMKRYSLESKFLVCTNISRNYTSPTRPPMETIRDLGVLPHDLETFFMFSIMFDEYDNKNIYEHKGSMIYRVLKSINNESTQIVQMGNNDFGNNLLQSYLPSQLAVQENSLLLIDRYFYYFSFKNNKVNIPAAFYSKFNVDFKNIIGCLQTLSILFTTDKSYNTWGFNQEVYNKIINYFAQKGYLSNFIVTREDYIKNQNFTCKNDINNFMFCVKYIYQYPFILFDSKLFLPLPHALKLAFTESLFFRLMDNNQKLKTLFGKEVFESYLFDLFHYTGIYEDVSREQKLGKNKLSSDVIIKNNGNYVFIEGKTTFPRAGLRVFDKNAEEFSFQFFSDSIMEIYNAITNYCALNQIDRDNCYGVFVSAIDDNLSLRLKYEQLKIRNAELSEEDYMYIISHIKSIKLYEIEELCGLSHTPIDKLLSDWAKSKDELFDITIGSKYARETKPLGLIKDLHDQISAISKSFIEELNKEGILSY